MTLADPIYSANVYCEGALDEVFGRIAVPLLDELRAADTGSYLWAVRYGRRGQHLKLRVHGAGLDPLACHRAVVGRAGELFAALGAPVVERAPQAALPPIDLEDEPEELHADRAVLRTRYRRSHVSLGGGPWLADDGYNERLTEGLARGCELVSAGLAGMPSAARAGARQRVLLKALTAGLPAAGFATPESAAGYLAYHRDWLLRFFLADGDEERAALAGFARQLDRMTATVESLRRIGLSPPPANGDAATPWATAVARLAAYLAPHRDDPEARSDPFAPDAVHPPLFKLFHGTANQAGLKALEEAFLHHLLLTALAPVARGGSAEGAA